MSWLWRTRSLWCGTLNASERWPHRFPPILIFPEGTTTNGHCLIDFKRGAFVPAVTVQPIVIKYPCHHYNPADTGRHSGNKSLFWLMLQFANWIEVTELDPYVEEQSSLSPPVLMGVMACVCMCACAGTRLLQLKPRTRCCSQRMFAPSWLPR